MQELLQYKDRDRWYLPTFAADDAPDWNQGRFVRSRQLAPGVKEVRCIACENHCNVQPGESWVIDFRRVV